MIALHLRVGVIPKPSKSAYTSGFCRAVALVGNRMATLFELL